MKKKIITTERLPTHPNIYINKKKEFNSETESKIQILTEKLANHFNKKLSNLIADKNYNFSNLISDIALFVRNLEDSHFEIDTVIPRLEKYLSNIYSKLPNKDHANNFSSNCYKKTTKLNQTESNNYNYDKDLNKNESHLYYIKSLPDITSKNKSNNNYNNILKENSVFASKSISNKAKLKTVAKTNSNKTLRKINNDDLENLNIPNKLQSIDFTDNGTEFNYYNSALLKSNSVAKVDKQIIDLNNKKEKNFIKKTEKLNDLKEKAMDEWAMIAKYNHLKYLDDQEKRKNFEEEKKRKVREILDNQMKEKETMRKQKQEEDKKFFKLQSEKINDLEKDYMEKEKIKIEKVKMQKEMHEKLIKGKIINYSN